MVAALLIHQDGRLADIDLPPLPVDRLAALQGHLDTAAAAVSRLTSSLNVWLDDDARGRQPANHAATGLADWYGFPGRPIHGSAVITAAGPDGVTVGLTQTQLIALATHLADIAAATRAAMPPRYCRFCGQDAGLLARRVGAAERGSNPWCCDGCWDERLR